jgi:hypothetical protein
MEDDDADDGDCLEDASFYTQINPENITALRPLVQLK